MDATKKVLKVSKLLKISIFVPFIFFCLVFFIQSLTLCLLICECQLTHTGRYFSAGKA